MANARSPSPSNGADDLSPTGTGPGTSGNKMRKRTKTGCLTCRKRRIKCGEERPTCANCIKSKRQCEGYNQRVIFKTPIENWPNHPGHVSTIQYHTSMLPGTRNQPYQPSQSTTQAQEGSLTSSHPQPMGGFEFASVDAGLGGRLPPSQQGLGGSAHHYPSDPSYSQPLPSPHHQPPLHSPHHSASRGSYFSQPSPVHTSPPTHFMREANATYDVAQQYNQPSMPYQRDPYNNTVGSEPVASQSMSQHPLYQPQHSTSHADELNPRHSHSSVSPRSDHYTTYTEAQSVLQQYNSHPQITAHSMQASSVEMSQAGHYNYNATVPHADFSHSTYPPVQIPMHNMTSDVKYMPQAQIVLDPSTQPHRPGLHSTGFAGEDHINPTQVLDEAAVEVADDDYWDVQSDEEMVDAEDDAHNNTILAGASLNVIRRIHLENSNELGIRRYDAFLYDGFLTGYRPEYTANPLRNPKTARVFAHFVHVTGPSISAYERNPRNSNLIFEGPTPAVQQGLWTYILPSKALTNQALLHAILALSSLHIARLQGASITPSYKHYAYALKRLGRSLGNPRKRHSISTLATSLLLAHYEVWTAEHIKWSTHLTGAAQLLAELDFRSLTREARRLKAAQIAQERRFPYQNPEMLIDQRQFDQRLEDSDMMPDERLVSTIVGNKISYDDFGMVLEESGARHESGKQSPRKLDLTSYEIMQDLYWWYCRHDVFQCMISSNSLITAYRKWSDCPPRAPLGRASASYGTHDSLILLVGRIMDYTIRDRERKLQQVKADGGWRPRAGMPGFGSMGPPPSTNMASEGQHPTNPMGPGHAPPMQGPPPGWTGPPPPQFGPPHPGSNTQGPPRGPPAPAMPTFLGMAPSKPHAPLSSSYANPNQKKTAPIPNIPHPTYSDLPSAYAAAIQEWTTIQTAHTTVYEILERTESFAPLPPDLHPPVPGSSETTTTPFGPLLRHRSYDISLIWALLHLAKILILRSHPAMPPAAQMAAGVCASATAPYAMLIGRIAASIPLGDELSPFLGAVLTESTMSLYFAGVQYQDAGQREWLVTRLLEVMKRTGFASAGQVARACETSWEKAAEIGRGPPYVRRTKVFEENLVNGPGFFDDSTIWREKEGRMAGGVGGIVGEGASAGGVGYVSEAHGAVSRDAEGMAENRERGYVLKSMASPWTRNLLGTEEDFRGGMERVGL